MSQRATVATIACLALWGCSGSHAGGSSGSGLRPMCTACSVNGDCGPEGSALCVTDDSNSGGHCAPICGGNADCTAGATCMAVSAATHVCYPASQLCAPIQTSGGSTGSTGTTTGGSTTTGSSTTTGGSTTGTTTGGSTTGTTTGGSTTTGGTTSSGTTGTTGAPLLRFAFTGDTRPASADDVAGYPAQVMQQIVSDLGHHNVAFALDTGDHVKIGKSDATADAQAFTQQMMQLYTGATDALGKPWYLTMGNHECWDNKSLCDNTDPVLAVFMQYVQRQVSTQVPYYTFDVPTPHGVATFVFVADTAWDTTEASWLDATLAHGDSSAYTIIAKHVPSSNVTDFGTNADEMQIIEAHKFALLLDSHAHLYQHAGEGGREVTLGLGGAPLSSSTDTFGYGLVEQQADGTLKVTEYDAATDAPKDSFTVAPN